MAMSGPVVIGVSGWHYADWQHNFYAGLPRKDWLRFCAQRFTGIEIDATFYRWQDRRTFARWREETPPDFRFAVKANRSLTHVRRLLDPEEPVRQERERAEGLSDQLAVVLWQLPASLPRDMGRLERFAQVLDGGSTTRHAVEFRHPSWFAADVAACLQAHRLAVCGSDAADWPRWEAITTDWVYVRLHGRPRTYVSPYDAAALDARAGRIRGWLDERRQVRVYFDNSAAGAAPQDALRLVARLGLLASPGFCPTDRGGSDRTRWTGNPLHPSPHPSRSFG